MKEKNVFLWAITISLINVLFLWNWWSYLTQAIGINLSVFWLLVLGFYIDQKRDELDKKSFLWIIPITFIAVSFSFYATIFTTTISVLILPLVFFLFSTHGAHENLRKNLWSRYFGVAFVIAIGHYIASIFQSLRKILLPNSNTDKKHVVTQVILGMLFLFIISVVIIVPLLSSVDSEFAKFFEDLINYIKVIEFWRVIIMIFGTIFILGLGHYWKKKISSLFRIAKHTEQKDDNSIMIGIVLGGILAIYLLFIGIQIKTLFISNLPANFSDAESLVKSGFWQLIILTAFNIIFYAGIYNKSTKNVQKILSAFTVTSLLLVVSAGHRVYMYVYNYGLSFEKFYALYTVIFCAIVFVWFISLLLRGNKEGNIVKTLMFTALWMYSVTTIIPLEKIIFSTNLKLTQDENSKVNINELRILGFDALELVEKNKDKLLEESIKDSTFKGWSLISEEGNLIKESKEEYETRRWEEWLDETRNSQYLYDRYHIDGTIEPSDKKKWYEKTFKENFYKPKYKITNNK